LAISLDEETVFSSSKVMKSTLLSLVLFGTSSRINNTMFVRIRSIKEEEVDEIRDGELII